MPHIPLDIDWRQWEETNNSVSRFDDTCMRRQTWFDDWDYTYHLALWENFDNADNPASLILTRVDKMGDSPYKQSSQKIGDSDNPEYWPELDRFFGSRRTWSGVLGSFRTYVKNHPYNHHGDYDD